MLDFVSFKFDIILRVYTHKHCRPGTYFMSSISNSFAKISHFQNLAILLSIFQYSIIETVL